MKIWILSWSYYDGSGYAVERAYASQQEAESDLRWISIHSDKKWQMTELTVKEEIIQ